MRVRFLGHSAVYIESDSKRLIIDPWIRNNPKALISFEQLYTLDLDYILVTHGHFDHGLEDGIDISKNTGAKIVGHVEMMQYAGEKGASTIPMNIGGYIRDGNLTIHMFQAYHTCPYGVPTSFVVSDGKTSIFHAGDTGLTRDFEIVAMKYKLDLAILPIGGRFTMSYEDVDIAKQMLKARRYVGIHYDTFPLITIDKNIAEKEIELYERTREIDI